MDPWIIGALGLLFIQSIVFIIALRNPNPWLTSALEYEKKRALEFKKVIKGNEEKIQNLVDRNFKLERTIYRMRAILRSHNIRFDEPSGTQQGILRKELVKLLTHDDLKSIEFDLRMKFHNPELSVQTNIVNMLTVAKQHDAIPAVLGWVVSEYPNFEWEIINGEH